MGQGSRGAATSTLDQLLAEVDGGGVPMGSTLLKIARCNADDDDDATALSVLRRLAASEDSMRIWTAAANLHRRLRARGAVQDGSMPLRVALLGTSTLDQLGQLLPLAALGASLDAEIYVGGFAQYESEVFDSSSSMYRFGPQIVVLAPDAYATGIPSQSDDPEPLLEAELARWTAVWDHLHHHGDARVLQLNFAPPLPRPLGSFGATLPGSRRSMFGELNRRLAAAAGSRVHIVDTEAVASTYGLERWWDDRYWFHAKQAFALGALPTLAREIVAVMQASVGRSRRCLVTDLDNTLWGGVVGDDGVGALKLAGSAVGEAHLAVQQQLLDLKDRGILLAVCSKNDDATARAPFEQREDMILSVDDFAAFFADWQPKSENLRRIAEQLGLGLDAFVFLDDNPAEREIVRQQLPDVDIIDLPSDPSGYRRALAGYRGFEPAALTTDDLARTELYRARASAVELRASAGSFEDYLESLQMVAQVRAFDDLTLPRIAQLVGKTNQWNLTTRRHSPETLRQMADDPDTLALSLRLEDRFADHGIVGVLIATVSQGTADIDTFLMSCRVIGRTVENALLRAAQQQLADHGVERIRGLYVHTERNGSVSDLYERLGFSLQAETAGQSTWELAAGTTDQSIQFIKVKEAT